MIQTSSRRALMFCLLLTSPALAEEPQKNAPWAQLAPLPGKVPAPKARPGEPAPCQPENFIPGETPYKRVTTEGTPSKLYELPTGEQMNINGWMEENERVVTLPPPYALTYYEFGCASSSSYVLDIARTGKRHALYQHVLDFQWYAPKQLFFFHQSERKNGRYQAFVGLVDLQTKKKTPLPSLDCVSYGNAGFSADRLVTYGEARAAKDGKTAVCVWNLAGKLQARVLADLDWEAASADVLLDRLGVLAHQPDVLYAIHYDRLDTGRCEVRLQSLTRANASKQVDLGVTDSQGACFTQAETKLATLRVEGP
jgi:hypothetical protein